VPVGHGIVFFHQQDGHSESRRRGVAPRVVGIVFCLTLIARKPAPEGRADSVALQDGFRVCAVISTLTLKMSVKEWFGFSTSQMLRK
jgi:hypothetical protein